MDPVYVWCRIIVILSQGKLSVRRLVKSLMHSAIRRSSINLRDANERRKRKEEMEISKKKKKRKGKKREAEGCVYLQLKGTVSTALFLIPQPREPS